MAADVPEALYEWLRDDIAAASVRALLVNDSRRVVQTGELVPEIIDELETARRDAGDPEVALCIAIQDAGEEKIAGLNYHQYVIVRAYDRFRGYSNIRAVREALLGIFRDFACKPEGQAMAGFLGYVTRTGHQFDDRYAVEYEAVTFISTVVRKGG